MKDLVNQFKAHVLCILEGSLAAVFHAASTHLDKLDSIQRSFTERVGLSEEIAFSQYNLAPLKLRRNIAALGFIHRSAIGKSHPEIAQLFPHRAAAPHSFPTRLANDRHCFQLDDRCDGTHNDLLHRSLFGMVRVYNLLPKRAAEKDTVRNFQKELTAIAMERCGSPQWKQLYCAETSPLVALH